MRVSEEKTESRESIINRERLGAPLPVGAEDRFSDFRRRIFPHEEETDIPFPLLLPPLPPFRVGVFRSVVINDREPVVNSFLLN